MIQITDDTLPKHKNGGMQTLVDSREATTSLHKGNYIDMRWDAVKNRDAALLTLWTGGMPDNF